MKYANLQWQNGQPYSPEFDDVYFSADNGMQETEHVFIHHNQLLPRFEQNKKAFFCIVETGFGSGLNFLIAVKHWLALSEPTQTLYFYSVEKTPFSLQDLKQAHQSWPALNDIAEALQQQYQVASYGFHQFDLFNGRVKLVLMLGEVDNMLTQMSTGLAGGVDAWFLDGFAPDCNPDMWSENVFLQIQRLSQKGSTFSTYTAAGFVRRGLMAQGFTVNKVSGIGKKRHMLAGKFTHENTPEFYSQQPWYESEISNRIKSNAVTIIGAGIAGISSAWALVKRGYQVQIFEAGNALGEQASGNSRGMIMPRLNVQDSADAEFYTSAYFYALRCLKKLDPQQQCWQQTGGLQLPSSERSKKQMLNYPQDASLVQTLDAQNATEICGLDIQQTVHYFPQAACVFPVKLLQKMIDEMGNALNIHYNMNIDAIDYVDEHWQLKNKQHEIVHKTPCLILANAWQLKKYAQLQHINLQAARGQLNYYQANARSKKLNMPLSFDAYLMPENNGMHVSGASFELDDCSTELSDTEASANLNAINQWFKHLFSQQDINGGRASVRAVTADRIPIVGPVAKHAQFLDDYGDLHKGKPANQYPIAQNLPNLYINSGYGARGFSSAFLSSELLAAIICDEPLPVSKRVRYALHSSRFSIRSLKKRSVNEKER